MIGDDQRRTGKAFEALTSNDAGFGHDHGCGPDEQVITKETNPSDRPALRPGRIRIIEGLAFGRRFFDKVFEIGHGRDLREIASAQVHLIAVFNGAHQLDAVQRTQPEIIFQPRLRTQLYRMPRYSLNEFLKSSLSGRGVPVPGELRFYCVTYQGQFWFLCGSAREIFIGPLKPAANLLEISQ